MVFSFNCVNPFESYEVIDPFVFLLCTSDHELRTRIFEFDYLRLGSGLQWMDIWINRLSTICGRFSNLIRWFYRMHISVKNIDNYLKQQKKIAILFSFFFFSHFSYIFSLLETFFLPFEAFCMVPFSLVQLVRTSQSEMPSTQA